MSAWPGPVVGVRLARQHGISAQGLVERPRQILTVEVLHPHRSDLPVLLAGHILLRSVRLAERRKDYRLNTLEIDAIFSVTLTALEAARLYEE